MGHGGRLPLHIAHLPVDAFHAVIVNEEVCDGAELRGVGGQRGLEDGSELEEVFGERDGDLDCVWRLPRADGYFGAGKLLHGRHGLVDIFTCGEDKKQRFKDLSLKLERNW